MVWLAITCTTSGASKRCPHALRLGDKHSAADCTSLHSAGPRKAGLTQARLTQWEPHRLHPARSGACHTRPRASKPPPRSRLHHVVKNRLAVGASRAAPCTKREAAPTPAGLGATTAQQAAPGRAANAHAVGASWAAPAALSGACPTRPWAWGQTIRSRLHQVVPRSGSLMGCAIRLAGLAPRAGGLGSGGRVVVGVAGVAVHKDAAPRIARLVLILLQGLLLNARDQ